MVKLFEVTCSNNNSYVHYLPPYHVALQKNVYVNNQNTFLDSNCYFPVFFLPILRCRAVIHKFARVIALCILDSIMNIPTKTHIYAFVCVLSPQHNQSKSDNPVGPLLYLTL